MTLPIKFANYAFSTLAVGCDSAATSLSVPAGHGARFPALAAGEYFYATLENAALNREIVKVTARVDDTLTVLRAQDNTTARSWNAGDSLSLRVNAAAFEDVADAKNHTYTPAGTGAIATTVQSKLRETVSVKDFGAVGDGVADDTNAFRLACMSVGAMTNAMAYREIYVPPGRYKITDTVYVRAGNVLYGSGMSTYIDASGFPGAGTSPVFKLGWGLVGGVPTKDTLVGDIPPEIFGMFMLGGPGSAAVVDLDFPGGVDSRFVDVSTRHWHITGWRVCF